MILYDARELCLDYEISNSTLKNWRKEGLPIYETRGIKNYFNSTDIRRWYMDYKRPLEVETDEMTKEEADLRLTIAREKKLQIEIQQKKKLLIDRDAVDSSQSALASLLVSQYKQLLLKLPNQLQNKSKEQITLKLDEIFEMNISKLKESAEKSYDG